MWRAPDNLELEVMYLDALRLYHEGPMEGLSDADFDKLKAELCRPQSRDHNFLPWCLVKIQPGPFSASPFDLPLGWLAHLPLP